jgi:hypothetical protein
VNVIWGFVGNDPNNPPVRSRYALLLFSDAVWNLRSIEIECHRPPTVGENSIARRETGCWLSMHMNSEINPSRCMADSILNHIYQGVLNWTTVPFPALLTQTAPGACTTPIGTSS